MILLYRAIFTSLNIRCAPLKRRTPLHDKRMNYTAPEVVVESSPWRGDEKANESSGVAGKGGGSEATGQGEPPDEGHNRHRVFRDAGERRRVGRDLPVCGIQRETPAQISGTAQRHSVARHDTARVRDGAVRVSTGVSRAVGPDRVRERRGKTPKDTGAGR